MHTLKTLAFTALLAACGAAQAQLSAEGPLLVRLRAVHVDPDSKSAPLGGVGPANQVDVGTRTIPEIDFSWFFTRNVAAELALTYPQRHDLSLSGVHIGSFKQMPPTLMLQYHFAPGRLFSPYLGAGLNYTRISAVNLGAVTLERHTTGFALQAGIDYRIDRDWSINVDLKKVRIRPDVFVAGARATTLKLDPVLLGVGVGYRF